MSDLKRKREAGYDRSEAREARRSRNVEVSHHQDCGDHIPILASSPGVSVPQSLSFQAYQRNIQGVNSAEIKLDLLLHSSQHRSLDFTAKESSGAGVESDLRHFVGIYDPDGRSLQLIPARKAILRGTMRSRSGDVEQAKTNADTIQNALSARQKLSLAFGNKKSQKAVKSSTANAIQASPFKNPLNGSPAKVQKLDAASKAVIFTMNEEASSMPSRQELQATVDKSKPRPTPHLDAAEPAGLYPVEELVGGSGILENIAVLDWINSINNGVDVSMGSLFVARRVVNLVTIGTVKKVKVLRYLLLLIEWYKTLKHGTRNVMRIPRLEDLGTLFEKFGSETVFGLATRFAEEGTLNSWHQHYLLTHILALSLHIDDFVSDTHDIRQDLRLEQRDLSKLFSELGCPLRLPNDRERTRAKITRLEGTAHRYAELTIPPSFPKQSRR